MNKDKINKTVINVTNDFKIFNGSQANHILPTEINILLILSTLSIGK